MYYNNNDKILIRKLPKNILRNDNSLFINFDQSDLYTLADYGFYTVRNDNIETNPNYIEDISKRIINLDRPYADIIRVWVDNSVKNPIAHTTHNIPDNNINSEL